MRAAALVVLLLLAIPSSVAQPSTGPTVTLDLDVQADHNEKLKLTFEGLKRLTRYEGLCLPEGAHETRVYDGIGDVIYEGKDENGRRVVTFTAREDKVFIDMTRPGFGEADAPLYAGNVNFCVPSDSHTVIHVRVPDRHTLFFLSNGAIASNVGSVTTTGPTHIFYSYEAPASESKPMTIIDEAPFRVFVATPLAPQAQEIAHLAAGPFQRSLEEAGLEMPFDAMRVLFAKETPFSWEAGHYNGHGFVAVKEDTLTGSASDGYPLSAARVLVHESFHGASFPYGKGGVEDSVAWWLEGTAKHSERQVDAALPNATHYCEKTSAEVRCWDFDDRIRRADLETGYGAGFRFDPKWEPSSPQNEDTRRFYYSYSEFVVEAWIERHGIEEYRRVWDEIEAAFEDDAGCPCKDAWLVSLLDDADLYRPWQDVKSATPDQFDALVTPYVKDEAALQRELDARSGPLSGLGIPIPAWATITALVIASIAGSRASRRQR